MALAIAKTFLFLGAIVMTSLAFIGAFFPERIEEIPEKRWGIKSPRPLIRIFFPMFSVGVAIVMILLIFGKLK